MRGKGFFNAQIFQTHSNGALLNSLVYLENPKMLVFNFLNGSSRYFVILMQWVKNVRMLTVCLVLENNSFENVNVHFGNRLRIVIAG